MPYDSLTSRSDVQAMIREQVSDVMLNGLQTESAVLNLFTRINVPTNQTRFPVLSALPNAYWVNGDTGLKQTTEAAWANKYINIEELAAIVPIPDSVLADASFDIWGSIRPLVENAIARALDAAVFFGSNAPASFPQNVAAAAVAAGNVVARGTATDAKGGIAEDINQLMGTLEADGYFPTGFVANGTLRARLRGARDTQGQLLMDVAGGTNNIWGQPTTYPMAGLWPTGTSAAELFALQRENFIVGVRQDFTVTASRDAVIQDNTGAIVYNSFQQDMTLYRIVFRAGWAVNNPINYDQATEASRYPAGVMRSPAT
ncbi:MAG TPA: phage major capsid protein [Thermomicrobiales bacterium]|nr:phage major capsid protein [Thermomicrobiales bacterium]